MLNLCRNVDAVAQFQLDGFFAFLLIISTSGYAYKNLSATALCMVDMPVVPAARLKCDIEDSNLTGGYRCQIALSDEILCTCIVWLSNWEYHFLCMRTHRWIFVRQIALINIPDFLCQIENCPTIWPSCVKCYMGDDRSDFLLCHTMCLRILQMEFQRRICDPLCYKCDYGNDASCLDINILVVPVFSK